MKIATPLAMAAILHLAGCAGLGAEDCRSSDIWYQIGWTAGSMNWDSLGRFAKECAPYGIQPDVAQYRKGWKDGEWAEAHRYPP